MRLWFKQRLFSWLDSYDIYHENGSVAYTVKGQLALGHCLHILDDKDSHVATLWQDVSSVIPRFELYEGDALVGVIRREPTFVKPHYEIDCNGWQVKGDFLAWDYIIKDPEGRVAATISKEFINLTDTYSIRVADPRDALRAVMVVLAIDADKCSRGAGRLWFLRRF